MPKLFIFAIGGTGERVMRSTAMLLASGVPAFDNYEVFPIIIDYDKKNADKKRTVELLQTYNQIHTAAYGRHTAQGDAVKLVNEFFAARLRNIDVLEDYVYPFHPAQENEKFRDYIGYKTLSGVNLSTSDFLESLFDKSSRPDTELNLDMTVGFKGNPNIGSVVFHTIAGTKEFNQIMTYFQPGNGDKVVVIGSLFGGTGASGIPEIVKAINTVKGNKAQIATILVLPYFNPEASDGAAIKAERFNAKTKAALDFYEKSGIYEYIKNVYYVGDPNPTIIPYCDGGDKQENKANFVELISAMMIEHFVAQRDEDKKFFKFAVDDKFISTPGQKAPRERLFIADFDKVSIQTSLNHLVTLGIALKFFHEEIFEKDKKIEGKDFYDILQAAKKKDSDAARRIKTLYDELDKFYTLFQDWLKELDFEGNDKHAPNSHRVALTDLSRKKYSDLFMEEAKTTEDDGGILAAIGDFITSRGSSLSEDNLFAFMNSAIGKHLQEKIKVLKDNHEAEWVFADILHDAASKGFDRINPLTPNKK